MIMVNIIKLFTALVLGPNKENQREIIAKKVLEVLDEINSMLFQMKEQMPEHDRSQAMLGYLYLKLGIIEGTTDNLIIKTMEIGFNCELLWIRLE